MFGEQHISAGLRDRDTEGSLTAFVQHELVVLTFAEADRVSRLDRSLVGREGQYGVHQRCFLRR